MKQKCFFDLENHLSKICKYKIGEKCENRCYNIQFIYFYMEPCNFSLYNFIITNWYNVTHQTIFITILVIINNH